MSKRYSLTKDKLSSPDNLFLQIQCPLLEQVEDLENKQQLLCLYNKYWLCSQLRSSTIKRVTRCLFMAFYLIDPQYRIVSLYYNLQTWHSLLFCSALRVRGMMLSNFSVPQ